MAGFNRDQFKAAKLEANKAQSAEVSKTLKVGSNSRGDYHSIDEGANLFRIFPPHNPEDPSFQAKVVYWIECKVQKTDSDGNPLEGQFEWKRRPIFDSRIHGETPKDIIDEYIKFTKQIIFDTSTDKKDASKQLSPINGWRGSDGKWNQGILPSSSFVAYATKGDITIPNIGRLELYQADKDELEKLNVDQDTGEVIQTDIFSGPDDGIQFVLMRSKNSEGKFVNKITKKEFRPKDSKNAGKEWEAFAESQVIPDDVLEHWSKMEPLIAQFKGAYKRSDFERSLEALQEFERKHGYHTFENDEFLDIVQEIDGYYPEEDETNTNKPDHEQPNEEKSEASGLDIMNREELKNYIKKNKLPIRVLNSMPEAVIIDMIREVEGDCVDNDPVEVVYAEPSTKDECETYSGTFTEAVTSEDLKGPNGEKVDKLPFEDDLDAQPKEPVQGSVLDRLKKAAAGVHKEEKK